MHRPAVVYRYQLSLRSTSMTFLTSGMMHTACGIPGWQKRKLLQQLPIERRSRRNTKVQAQQKGNTMKDAPNTADKQIKEAVNNTVGIEIRDLKTQWNFRYETEPNIFTWLVC